MTRTQDHTTSGSAPTAGPVLGEALTFHGPGWTIEADHYDVICWAPGEILDKGKPTGQRRAAWMLSVEVGPVDSTAGALTNDCSADARPSSGFATGASLGEVLPALALLPDADRSAVIEALFRNLGGIDK